MAVLCASTHLCTCMSSFGVCAYDCVCAHPLLGQKACVASEQCTL